MIKYKVVEAKSINNLEGFNVLYKKSWYTRWKYVRDHAGNIGWWGTKRKAQAYINFLPKDK